MASEELVARTGNIYSGLMYPIAVVLFCIMAVGVVLYFVMPKMVELYSALARFPEACQQYFGLRSFEVHVSVIDTLKRAPIERLRALQAAASMSAAPSSFRFTLGGWLFAFPAEAIWFAERPRSESVRWRDHQSLTR